MWAHLLGLTMLFMLFTRLSDLYRPTGWPLSLNQMLVAAVFGLLLLSRQRLVADRGLVWMLAYGAAIGLSALGAVDRLATIAALMAYLHEAVIVFVLVNLVTSLRTLRLATWTIVLAATFVAALAVVRAGTGVDLGALTMVDFGNLAGAEVGYRLAGTIGNSNAFAQMLVCALPLALYRAWGDPSRGLRLVAFCSVGLMTSVLILTYSRGGAVAFLTTVVISLALRRFRLANVLSVAAVLMAATLMTPSTYWNRVTITAAYVTDTSARTAREAAAAAAADATTPPEATGAEGASNLTGVIPTSAGVAPAPAVVAPDAGSLPERLSLWRVGLLMIRDHPLIGVGKNNYLLQYPAYAAQVDSALVSSPKVAHSTPIQILADTGAVGLLAFAGLVAVVLAGAWWARRAYGRASQSAATLLVEPIVVAICGYLMTSVFQSDDYPRFLWLLLGLAMAARQITLGSKTARSEQAGG